MSKMVASNLDTESRLIRSDRNFIEKLIDPLTRIGHYVQYGIKHSGEDTFLVWGNTVPEECYCCDTINLKIQRYAGEQ